VAAYGLLVDDDQVLVVQAGPASDVPGRWFLPGGGVEHGEDPVETVQREFLEETGLAVAVGELVGVWSEMIEASARAVEVHSVAIVYEIDSWTGEVAPLDDAVVAWQPIAPDDDARMDFVRRALRTHLPP
jgi:8-oxo-dGTP pyrophosphatase MutT (NUDIX family)